jgi:hypothetical protein
MANDKHEAKQAFEHYINRGYPTEFREQPVRAFGSLTQGTHPKEYVPPNPSDETEVATRSRLSALERYEISVRQENAERRAFPIRYQPPSEQIAILENAGVNPNLQEEPRYLDVGRDQPALITGGNKKDYERASKRQGSAEFLSTLLHPPDFACPHKPKLKAGLGTTIPPMLGFFHDTTPKVADIPVDKDSNPAEAIEAGEWYITRLRTEKLCDNCFKLAAPRGFNTWSLTYNNMAEGWNLPPQVVAGQEGFQYGGLVDKKRLMFFPGLKTEGARYGYAAPEHGRAVFEFLEHLGDPIYLDLLHLEPPYNDDFRPRELENIRVNTMNGPAYLGATFIVADCNDGGKGISSSLEVRIAAVTGRLIELPKNWKGLPRGQLPPDLDARKLYTDPKNGMLLENPSKILRDNNELHFLSSPHRPAGVASTSTLLASQINAKHREFVKEYKEYEALLQEVEDWSCPPGFPHFYNITIADQVDKLQREVTRFDPFNGVDELSEQEAYKMTKQALQFRRWRQSDKDWLTMRSAASRKFNNFLRQNGVPETLLLSETDPAGLASAMPVGSEPWKRWQEYRAEKPGLNDREMYPGYAGIETEYDKWSKSRKF